MTGHAARLRMLALQYAPLLMFLVLIAVFGSLSERFLTPVNFVNIVTQAAHIAIIAIGIAVAGIGLMRSVPNPMETWAFGPLLAILCAVLAVWRISGEPMSMADIRTRRTEVLYWTAILFSNTLGTALGDFLADDSGLGFAGGALLISGLLAAVVAAHYLTRASAVLLFWIAFVLTRPFGAMLGDLLTKPQAAGGLDFGTVGSSAILLAALVVLIVATGRGRPASAA